MAEGGRAFLQRAEAAFAGVGLAPVRRLGHSRMVEPAPGVALTVSVNHLELTVVARHAGRPPAEVEAELRGRLGDRLGARGYVLTHADTTESTLPDAGPEADLALVTELVWQREVGLDNLVAEIRFLAELTRGPSV